jgi:hypothetical protein
MLSQPSVQRRCDLDWLRVLLILTVLIFHSLRLFDLEVLFVFSLVCLPLFLWLRNGSGQHLLF